MRIPIEDLDPYRPARVREWFASQPHNAAIASMAPEEFRLLSAPVLTLAHYLRPHRESLVRGKWNVPAIPIALIGVSEIDGYGAGWLYRYLPRLLGIEREFWFILAGREVPHPGEFHHLHHGYPARMLNVCNDWSEVEQMFIRGGIAHAFLFHPGFHNRPENMIRATACDPTDFLQKGSLRPLLEAGIPVGMATYDEIDGKHDNEYLRPYHLRAVNPRLNPWGLYLGDTGLVDLSWAKILWDLELNNPRLGRKQAGKTVRSRLPCEGNNPAKSQAIRRTSQRAGARGVGGRVS